MAAEWLPPKARRIVRRDFWVAVGPPLLIVAAAFGVTMFFVKPAPPKKITMAIAPDEGGSRYYARRYQEILKRNGVTLDVKQTNGSLANVRVLAEGGADVAFVQSGTDAGQSGGRVLSLGSVAYVPLWLFYRGEPMEDVRDLKGRRIAVGAAESGTRALAVTLLAASAADKPPTELLPLERDAAIEQLRNGAIDAVFLVSPAEAPSIQKLTASPGVSSSVSLAATRTCANSRICRSSCCRGACSIWRRTSRRPT
jgi:TRAP-type uncharacterized transport system substrate-binding protein